MSDTGAALLQAICEVPADDNRRLRYADWLRHHDRPDEAEFVAVGVELYRLGDPNRVRVPGDPNRRTAHRVDATPCWWPAAHGPCPWCSRQRRLEDLYVSCLGHREAICGLPDWSPAWYRRGLLYRVEATWTAWLDLAEPVCWRPGWTRRCPTCAAAAHPDPGLVPRPFRPGSHPVEVVCLTTDPAVYTGPRPRRPNATQHRRCWLTRDYSETGAPGHQMTLEHLRYPDLARERVTRALLVDRWPGVTFVLPADRTTAEYGRTWYAREHYDPKGGLRGLR